MSALPALQRPIVTIVSWASMGSPGEGETCSSSAYSCCIVAIPTIAEEDAAIFEALPSKSEAIQCNIWECQRFPSAQKGLVLPKQVMQCRCCGTRGRTYCNNDIQALEVTRLNSFATPTLPPTTSGPTTSGPTTSGPTTSGPTTSGPTTSGPTTAGSTTMAPTQRPAGSPTTYAPTTSAPTQHGTHGCDSTEFGIGSRLLSSPAAYRCSCASTHRCSDGDCSSMGHTCVPVTDSPTSSPTTARPTDGPPGLPPLDFDFSDGDAAGDGLSSTFAALVGLAALVLVLIGVVVCKGRCSNVFHKLSMLRAR